MFSLWVSLAMNVVKQLGVILIYSSYIYSRIFQTIKMKFVVGISKLFIHVVGKERPTSAREMLSKGFFVCYISSKKLRDGSIVTFRASRWRYHNNNLAGTKGFFF